MKNLTRDQFVKAMEYAKEYAKNDQDPLLKKLENPRGISNFVGLDLEYMIGPISDDSKCDTFYQGTDSPHPGLCDICRRPFSEH